jgi:F-type H+-transporting ATPase subunit epsilon
VFASGFGYKKHMQFTLITPTQQLADFTATYVNIPGEAGYFGVLPGHMPLVSTLQPGGQVQATDETGQQHTFTLTAGIANVQPTKVVILAEDASTA